MTVVRFLSLPQQGALMVTQIRQSHYLPGIMYQPSVLALSTNNWRYGTVEN
jgi:hypothetical protein